jgi:hypothetical protein
MVVYTRFSDSMVTVYQSGMIYQAFVVVSVDNVEG